MKAMILPRIVSLDDVDEPLELVELPVPEPADDELLVEVSACGVCHTELDEIEGRTPPSRFPMILGHEIVGRVVQRGRRVTKFVLGDRVGIGWIHSSCGGPRENLSARFRATGRDAPGGYAELTTVPENYAYPIPDVFEDARAAPLLCAGAVGFRALRLTGIRDGQSLGLTGFGGSGHLVLQLARRRFPRSEVYVFARDPAARAFALELGAVWAGETSERAPVLLDAVIDTTPAWKPIVEALKNLAPGGRLVINAIRKEARDQEALLDLNYHEDLWMEREMKSVANVTADDIREFLLQAAEIPLRPEIQTYPLEAANQALRELHREPVRGAKVLQIKSP
jgi:alcohol dehydrogenase, propanol-preferring